MLHIQNDGGGGFSSLQWYFCAVLWVFVEFEMVELFFFAKKKKSHLLSYTSPRCGMGVRGVVCHKMMRMS